MPTESVAGSGPTIRPKLHRYEALDGLRGIAAIAVALGHLVPGVFPNTTLAVDFFFILSGFVLFHTYEPRLTGGLSFGRYFLARCIRLMPLIVVGTMLGMIAQRTLSGWWGAALIPDTGPVLYPLNPPAWSLLFEMIASALLGLGLWRRWTWNVALLGLSAIGMVVATIHRGTLDVGWELGAFHYGLTRVVFGFSLGTLLYRLELPHRFPLLPVIAIFIGLLLFPWPHPLFQLLALFVFSPLIIVSASNSAGFRGAEVLGELSYPLYITHYPLFALLAAVWGPLAFAIAVALGWGALVLYDRPVRAWLTRRMNAARSGRIPKERDDQF